MHFPGKSHKLFLNKNKKRKQIWRLETWGTMELLCSSFFTVRAITCMLAVGFCVLSGAENVCGPSLPPWFWITYLPISLLLPFNADISVPVVSWRGVLGAAPPSLSYPCGQCKSQKLAPMQSQSHWEFLHWCDEHWTALYFLVGFRLLPSCLF